MGYSVEDLDWLRVELGVAHLELDPWGSLIVSPATDQHEHAVARLVDQLVAQLRLPGCVRVNSLAWKVPGGSGYINVPDLAVVSPVPERRPRRAGRRVGRLHRLGGPRPCRWANPDYRRATAPVKKWRCNVQHENAEPIAVLAPRDRSVTCAGGVSGTADGARPDPHPPPPLLRGWFHLAAFLVSLPAGMLVVAAATSTKARAAAVIYAVALATLFAVSSTYHLRVWTPDGRRRMRRLDHGTIYVMIAGCYTPICLLAVTGPTSTGLLVAAWVGAGIGLGFAITGLAEKPIFGLSCYLGMGWLVLIALPQLSRHLSPLQLGLLVVGGMAYTVGSLVLGLNWPNPFPRVFGYHEVWHVLVIVACACHYVIIYSVVRAAV